MQSTNILLRSVAVLVGLVMLATFLFVVFRHPAGEPRIVPILCGASTAAVLTICYRIWVSAR